MIGAATMATRCKCSANSAATISHPSVVRSGCQRHDAASAATSSPSGRSSVLDHSMAAFHHTTPVAEKTSSHSHAKTASMRASAVKYTAVAIAMRRLVTTCTASTPRPSDTGTPKTMAPSGPSARAGGTVPDIIPPHRPSGRSRSRDSKFWS
jgi:hypothetical protein